jgi:hypothetical protein
MAVSDEWKMLFARMRAWAIEPGALVFAVVTEHGTLAIFPEEVGSDDDALLGLIERRSRGDSA